MKNKENLRQRIPDLHEVKKEPICRRFSLFGLRMKVLIANSVGAL